MREALLRRHLRYTACAASLIMISAVPGIGAAQTPATDTAATQPTGTMYDNMDDNDDMDWGWIGLLGLAGLLGLRRRDHVDRYTPPTSPHTGGSSTTRP